MLNLILYHLNVLIVFVLFLLAYCFVNVLRKSDFRYQTFSQILLRAFPSSPQEIPKFGFLRVIFGLFLLKRCANEWLYILPQDSESLLYVTVLSVTAVLSISITIGFLTNIALIGMVVIYFGESFLRASTLGNDVAAIVSLMLVFCYSYKTYSLDNLISKRFLTSWNWANLNNVVNINAHNSDLQISRAKYVAVLSYWCLCIYSAFKHFSSSTWMNGDAAIYLLTSSYLNEHFEFFRTILSYELVADFFRYSMFLMFPWYLVFLPAFFIRGVLLWFTVIWWMFFLILSHFVLNLSFLGLFEFVFFIGLLYVPGRDRKKTITFFYDGKCNLCAKAIKTIKFLDVTRRVRFVTAQSGQAFLEARDVSQDVALTELAGLYNDRIYIGYSLYNLLAHKMPLLWVTVPFFHFGRLGGIGSKLYKKIADNRIKMFGTCALPKKRYARPISLQSNRWTRLNNKAATATICLFALIFLSNPPIYPRQAGGEDIYRSIFGSLYRTGNIFGIAAIDVFNYQDLNMSTNWRVMEYCADSSDCQLMPLNGSYGERLEYYNSDTLYFGGTLKWRRKNIGILKLCDYGKDDFVSTKYIDEIAKMHLRKINKNSGLFKIHYYNNPLPDLSKENWVKEFDNPKRTCTVTLKALDDQSIEFVEKTFHE